MGIDFLCFEVAVSESSRKFWISGFVVEKMTFLASSKSDPSHEWFQNDFCVKLGYSREQPIPHFDVENAITSRSVDRVQK